MPPAQQASKQTPDLPCACQLPLLRKRLRKMSLRGRKTYLGSCFRGFSAWSDLPMFSLIHHFAQRSHTTSCLRWKQTSFASLSRTAPQLCARLMWPSRITDAALGARTGEWPRRQWMNRTYRGVSGKPLGSTGIPVPYNLENTAVAQQARDPICLRSWGVCTSS